VKTIEELRRALEDETTGLPMNISTERIRRRARAVRRGRVVAVAAGALAVLLTVAGIIGLPHRASPPVLSTQVGPTTIYYRDGTTVLAQTGGEEGPSSGQNVVSIPFTGGAATVLVRRASTPDWNA